MTYKTPGIYVSEKRVFGKSVPTNDTATPFFIGLTPNGENGTAIVKEVANLQKYIEYFGYGHYDLSGETPSKKYYLFESVALYFANGGAPCYVASVGSFAPANNQLRIYLEQAFEKLDKHPKANLVVVPDACALNDDPRSTFFNNLLAKCGPNANGHLANRFALLDASQGLLQYAGETVLNNLNTNLAHGAMYHPWLLPSAIAVRDVEAALLGASDVIALQGMINGAAGAADGFTFAFPDAPNGQNVGADDLIKQRRAALRLDGVAQKRFNNIITECLKLAIPPSGAVAGAYVRSDQQFGIQKAPANIKLTGVKELSAFITDSEQESYNIPDSGKAINCLRVFLNNGIKIWGARTLDANGDDFRYISTRRSMSMLQQSIKTLLEDFIFEDNVPRTWIKIRAAVSKFLREMMNRGVLAGSTPSEAFSLAIGLGETMTQQNINDGIMRLEVKVALVRPAEFIEVSFEQMAQADGTATSVDPQLN